MSKQIKTPGQLGEECVRLEDANTQLEKRVRELEALVRELDGDYELVCEQNRKFREQDGKGAQQRRIEMQQDEIAEKDAHIQLLESRLKVAEDALSEIASSDCIDCKSDYIAQQALDVEQTKGE